MIRRIRLTHIRNGILLVSVAVILTMSDDISISRRQTEILGLIVAATLTAIALWQWYPVRIALKQHLIAWRYSVESSGLVMIVVACFGNALLLITKTPVPASEGAAYLLPLLVGLQAPFLLSPEDEPFLEPLLATPRPLTWALVERFGLLLVGLFPAAILYAILVNQWQAAFTWLLPAMFFGSVGVYVTLRSRVAIFGTLVAMVMWAGALYVSQIIDLDAAFPAPLHLVQPFLWSFAPYLPAHFAGAIPINRLLVSAITLQAFVASMKLLGDDEYILIGEHT